MEYKDYYKIMGLSRDASPEEIKRAYRKLARKYHPDVSKEPDAETKFKELGEAYEVLKDPKKRAAYDQVGRGWQEGQSFTPPPDWGFDFGAEQGFTGTGGGFSDFFEALFGRGFGAGRGGVYGRQAHMQGSDQHARIQIDLEDAYRGADSLISLNVPQTDSQGHLVSSVRTLNVKIPKGIKAGQRIRLAGQGMPGVGGGRSGDLYLEIEFKPHRYFRAEGRDIHLELPVTPWEAALGATVPVPTLGGTVELKVPAGSQAGKQLRLKSRGLPGTPAGDQYVTLKIVTPSARTDEAKALYEQMAKVMPMNPRAAMGV
ncbi:DnaJ C-terminal domain-containing protein [Methylobacter marinus]|uniref:DnaJ C-terminal domain-containing protein n=1 Tax=Methylobacter marinus TaxID=34058 RepID=UPI0003715793|nr:DnaJ C-terminal domain-containing protein [Methylobacter marinus]